MARIEQFKCDGCGKLRGDDANHWYEVITNSEVKERPILCVPLAHSETVAIQFRHSEAVLETLVYRFREIKHFCGQDCALKFISAQMAGGKG